jgi:hypothetical protein
VRRVLRVLRVLRVRLLPIRLWGTVLLLRLLITWLLLMCT